MREKKIEIAPKGIFKMEWGQLGKKTGAPLLKSSMGMRATRRPLLGCGVSLGDPWPQVHRNPESWQRGSTLESSIRTQSQRKILSLLPLSSDGFQGKFL